MSDDEYDDTYADGDEADPNRIDDDELEDEGFAEDGAVRRMVRAALRQTPTPDRIVVGRRDPTDASWTAALDAIRTSSSDWYAFTIEDRDATSIAAAATWAAELAAVTPDAFDSTLALSMSLTDGNASGIANFSALLKVRALHAVRALRDPDYTDPYTLAVPAQAPAGVRIGFVVSF